MKLNITGKNINVSDYLRDLVKKKVGKLNCYFKDETEAQITLSVEKQRHICEVTIPFDGAIIRAKEISGDMYASIDNVVDKLEKQIHKHRTKLEKRLRTDAFTSSAKEPPQLSQPRRVVRTKRFALKPMDVQEAIMQMELLEHSFYVFTNANTNEVNVLYLRADGNLGLIEPSFVDDDE